MTKQVLIKVSTNVARVCPLCNSYLDGIKKFEDACSHLLNEHGLTCLHVGQETDEDFEGKPSQSTVAIFGNFPIGQTK